MLNDATKQFICEHRLDDVRQLAFQSRSLSGSAVDIPLALTQIKGRQAAENKIPTWAQLAEIIYPPALALEQCSSESTARYKASLLTGNTFVDLTGGFGVDFVFISQKFNQSRYVEKQANLCEIAAHNFSTLGLKTVEIKQADGIEYLREMLPVDLIFIDPSRRSGSGGKVVGIQHCEPDLSLIQDLLLEKAECVLIKLSPMLDISQALTVLKNVSEVHVVSHENECKELLFLLKRDFVGESRICCVNLSKKVGEPEISFFPSQEKTCGIDYASQIGSYLYEPNASILKAGFFKGPTLIYPVHKLHTDSHLYTSDELIPDFPGRIFSVEDYSTFNKKALKNLLCGIDKAHISTRNFPLTVAALRKRLKLKEGGEIYLFATTSADGKHIIIKGRK